MTVALNKEIAETEYVIRTIGGPQPLRVSIEDYRAAADNNISLTSHLAKKAAKSGMRVDAANDGSIFMQLCAQTGMFLNRDINSGHEPPTLKAIMSGVNLGPIVSPDGSDSTPAGRLLFPELIMQVMEAALYDDHTDFLSSMEEITAITQSIRGDQFVQPKIVLDGPKGSRANLVAQGAEPTTMVTITTTQTTRNIMTKSIGLSITDKAAQASTLDLVSLAVTNQAREERVDHWESMLADMIAGNADVGESAIAAAVTAQSLDTAVTTAGTISQKAWLKWLRRYYKKMRITHVLASLDTALAVESRSGRPGLLKDLTLDANFTTSNLMITEPKIILMDEAIVGANTMIGIDKSKAIRRVINIEGNYQAIEKFVLQRLTQYRFDYAETAHKLYPEAWDRLALTV